MNLRSVARNISRRWLARTCVGASVFLLQGGAATSASGQSPDLSRFDDEERYVVDGQPIFFHRVPNEFVVQFNSTNAPLELVASWSQSSRHELAGVRELSGQTVLCGVPTTNDPATTAATLEALRNDSAVRYVYPIYRGITSGGRIFLTDEVIVGGGANDIRAYWELGLRRVDTLSASIQVFRLLTPKRVNPFKICDALRAMDGVTWAEPNKLQEWYLGPEPWTPVTATFQTNAIAVVPGNPFALSNLVFLRAPAFTRFEKAGGDMAVEWPLPAALQSAGNLDGPWTDVPGATSPYVAPLSGGARFFRLRW